ncbi:MAG: hypothetical protein Q8Q31_01820 [Nanoarchaeota archaeon]|nr:hypothetical protein [Nanoarchaeota archaeon]
MNLQNNDISKHILHSGTSIAGIVCKDGIVMAGDRRSTLGGQIVYSRKAKKVVQVNDYLLIAGTGIASDIELTRKLLSAELRLKELKTRSRPTVREAAHLLGMMTFKNIRTPSMITSIVGSLMGGFNDDGTFELYSILPDGDVEEISDFSANVSSGMPYILGLLERQHKKDISVKDAVDLGKDCIKAAMERDVASGNGIDVFTITKDGIKHVVSEEIVAEYK